MFSKLIAWLSKRFPEQLTVSLQDYTQLREEVASYNRAFQGIIELNNRLMAVEQQIKRINEANGFASNVKGPIKLER